jgi:hypothetical protein
MMLFASGTDSATPETECVKAALNAAGMTDDQRLILAQNLAVNSVFLIDTHGSGGGEYDLRKRVQEGCTFDRIQGPTYYHSLREALASTKFSDIH